MAIIITQHALLCASIVMAVIGIIGAIMFFNDGRSHSQTTELLWKVSLVIFLFSAGFFTGGMLTCIAAGVPA